MKTKEKTRMTLNLKNKRTAFLLTFFAFCLLNAGLVQGQTPPPPAPAPFPPKTKVWRPGKVIRNESDIPAEKSLVVDAKVNVSLCVSEGNVKINGWGRNEIRVFVERGSAVGFLVRDKSRQSGSPTLVNVLGFNPAKNTEVGLDECLSGEQIELDVPRGATVSLKSRESEIAIESVARVRVENISGDIMLNEIAQGIYAKTYEGDVIVEKSSGAMTLSSTTGNIVAVEIDSSDIGDVFSAKTSSGAVTMQQIGHKQIGANTNSGAIKFVGEFSNGGQYNFGTTNGSILLNIPPESSFKMTAAYGGSFQTELQLKDAIKTFTTIQKLTGLLGTGDATLNLTTLSGAILIKKMN